MWCYSKPLCSCLGRGGIGSRAEGLGSTVTVDTGVANITVGTGGGHGGYGGASDRDNYNSGTQQFFLKWFHTIHFIIYH